MILAFFIALESHSIIKFFVFHYHVKQPSEIKRFEWKEDYGMWFLNAHVDWHRLYSN